MFMSILYKLLFFNFLNIRSFNTNSITRQLCLCLFIQLLYFVLGLRTGVCIPVSLLIFYPYLLSIFLQKYSKPFSFIKGFLLPFLTVQPNKIFLLEDKQFTMVNSKNFGHINVGYMCLLCISNYFFQPSGFTLFPVI